MLTPALMSALNQNPFGFCSVKSPAKLCISLINTFLCSYIPLAEQVDNCDCGTSIFFSFPFLPQYKVEIQGSRLKFGKLCVVIPEKKKNLWRRLTWLKSCRRSWWWTYEEWLVGWERAALISCSKPQNVELLTFSMWEAMTNNRKRTFHYATLRAIEYQMARYVVRVGWCVWWHQRMDGFGSHETSYDKTLAKRQL